MTPVPTIDAGQRRHRVTLQNPSEPVPDGEGGYTETWTDLVPGTFYMRIQPASASDMERVASGTVSSTATHMITGPYHPDVSTKSRVLWTDIHGGSHEFAVTSVINAQHRDVEMTLVCQERVE